MSMRRATLLVWAAALLPVALALVYLRAADSAGAGALLNLLGRLTGIGGLAFLLMAAILSCRVPGFDRPFGGLTKLWHTHHKLGGVAWLLLLAHPLLLALAAAEVSLDAAARTLFPQRMEWGALWGWAALLVMMAFLAPSFAFFGEPHYQRWRMLHRLSAAAVVAALAHTFLVARTMPGAVNALVWATFALAAVGAVAYRLIFSSRLGRLSYVVAEVARPANNIVELALEPRGQHLVYEPGQFVYLAPYDSTLAAGHAEEHPYTLSSAPAEPRLRVAIKDLGDASRALQHVTPGSEVRIEGPYGDFFADTGPGLAELWIAGGIGITPFLGRARHLARQSFTSPGAGLDVQLVYCVQDEARAHFADELRELAACVPGLHFTLHYFYREGPLEAAFLARHCRDFHARQVYVCGPTALIDRASHLLTSAGVPRARIHTEELKLL